MKRVLNNPSLVIAAICFFFAESVVAKMLVVVVDDENPAKTAKFLPTISATYQARGVPLQMVPGNPPRYRLAKAILTSKLGLAGNQLDTLILLKLETAEGLVPYWEPPPSFRLRDLETPRRVWLLSKERYYQKRIEQAMKFESDAKTDPMGFSEDRWSGHFRDLQDALAGSGIIPGRDHIVRVGTGLEVMIKTNKCTSAAQSSLQGWFHFFDQKDKLPSLKDESWARQQFSDLCNAIADTNDPKWRVWFTDTILIREFDNGFSPTNGHATIVDRLLEERQPEKAMNIVFAHLVHGLEKEIPFQEAWVNRGIGALIAMNDNTIELGEFRDQLDKRLKNVRPGGERACINKALARLTREFPALASN